MSFWRSLLESEMSLFGNIFDKNTNFSTDSAIRFDTECVEKIANFIDAKISTFKERQSPRKSNNVDDHLVTQTEEQAMGFKAKLPTKENAYQPEEVKTFDLSPKNMDIVDYCKSLICIHFHGQCHEDDVVMTRPPTVFTSRTKLSEAMMALDDLLRNVDMDFSGEEEEFQYYVQACMEARHPKSASNRRIRRKFALDAKKFVQIYKERSKISEELTHSEYWASRQQLLSGKVVADWIDPNYGPLDPIFGVLLNPTLGRTGPGDSGWVHKILFDDDGPMAYHSAVHDAFGYLITNHDIGPGYDYLGAWSLFESKICMSGQLSGIKFWRDVLKDCANVDEKIH